MYQGFRIDTFCVELTSTYHPLMVSTVYPTWPGIPRGFRNDTIKDLSAYLKRGKKTKKNRTLEPIPRQGPADRRRCDSRDSCAPKIPLWHAQIPSSANSSRICRRVQMQHANARLSLAQQSENQETGQYSIAARQLSAHLNVARQKDVWIAISQQHFMTIQKPLTAHTFRHLQLLAAINICV